MEAKADFFFLKIKTQDIQSVFAYRHILGQRNAGSAAHRGAACLSREHWHLETLCKEINSDVRLIMIAGGSQLFLPLTVNKQSMPHCREKIDD